MIFVFARGAPVGIWFLSAREPVLQSRACCRILVPFSVQAEDWFYFAVWDFFSGVALNSPSAYSSVRARAARGAPRAGRCCFVLFHSKLNRGLIRFSADCGSWLVSFIAGWNQCYFWVIGSKILIFYNFNHSYAVVLEYGCKLFGEIH
jgi:hypothetical protein